MLFISQKQFQSSFLLREPNVFEIMKGLLVFVFSASVCWKIMVFADLGQEGRARKAPLTLEDTNDKYEAVVEEKRGNAAVLSPFKNERGCSQQGGLCVEAEFCPSDMLADKPEKKVYLCPAQKDKGAACCFGLPNKKLPCGIRGGLCRETCGTSLVPDPLGICPDANGGGSGELCCPLLL
ncbi:unnamed protein product [Notodromas monacha]|uniref:Uncharacterized protein n=1 Tax=Notodromas monacha TaxID=399045 RepID=A0A7R9BQ10_9CRUS|nr:unnamed protein product [Notodromas monacha]CAG0918676.1 unnamed protein product [Notodromas monacha]